MSHKIDQYIRALLFVSILQAVSENTALAASSESAVDSVISSSGFHLQL